MKEFAKKDYGYYLIDNPLTSIPPAGGKTAALNYYDEIVKGSHERDMKINAVLQKKIRIGSPNFMKKYAEIIHELHNLIQEELMLLNDWSEREANLWIDSNIDFNHVKTHRIDGQDYLSVDPIIRNKYKKNK